MLRSQEFGAAMGFIPCIPVVVGLRTRHESIERLGEVAEAFDE